MTYATLHLPSFLYLKSFLVAFLTTVYLDTDVAICEKTTIKYDLSEIKCILKILSSWWLVRDMWYTTTPSAVSPLSKIDGRFCGYRLPGYLCGYMKNSDHKICIKGDENLRKSYCLHTGF